MKKKRISSRLSEKHREQKAGVLPHASQSIPNNNANPLITIVTDHRRAVVVVMRRQRHSDD
jgi:hypothetical protein